MLKIVLTSLVLLYFLHVIMCHKWPPPPYHQYETKSLTNCSSRSDCKKWQKCFVNSCISFFTLRCFKHWHCRGYRRCVDYLCREPPIPIDPSQRAPNDGTDCDCNATQTCFRNACYDHCEKPEDCPFLQTCGYRGHCYW